MSEDEYPVPQNVDEFMKEHFDGHIFWRRATEEGYREALEILYHNGLDSETVESVFWLLVGSTREEYGD